MKKNINKVCRIYMRVSTSEQDLTRQEKIIDDAQNAGYYIADIYKEKISGTLPHAKRPELNRLIKSLQVNDVIMIEKMDRLTRLPFSQAQELIETIRAKGATLCISNVPDLSGFYFDEMTQTHRIILDTIQELLLNLALVQARDNYEDLKRRQAEGIKIAKKNKKYTGRQKDINLHNKIIKCRFDTNMSIKQTSLACDCSLSTVKRVSKEYKVKNKSL